MGEEITKTVVESAKNSSAVIIAIITSVAAGFAWFGNYVSSTNEQALQREMHMREDSATALEFQRQQLLKVVERNMEHGVLLRDAIKAATDQNATEHLLIQEAAQHIAEIAAGQREVVLMYRAAQTTQEEWRKKLMEEIRNTLPDN